MFRPLASHFFLPRQEKVTKKNATLAGSATTPAGRKLISLQLLEFAESSTFGNSTAAIGGRPQLRCKTEKLNPNLNFLCLICRNLVAAVVLPPMWQPA
jgi:hypothetical protein